MKDCLSPTVLTGFSLLALRTLVHEECPLVCHNATCPVDSQLVNASTPGCCQCTELDPAVVPPMEPEPEPEPGSGAWSMTWVEVGEGTCADALGISLPVNTSLVTNSSDGCRSACADDQLCMAYYHDSFVDTCFLYGAAGETTNFSPTDDSCFNKVVHPETEILRLPTPGLGDCSDGCACGPGAPILTDQVPTCESVNNLAEIGQAELIDTSCKVSFEGDVSAGTGVPCERLYDAATGNIACTTGAGLCTGPEAEPEPEPEPCCMCGPNAPVRTNLVTECANQNTDNGACESSYQPHADTDIGYMCELSTSSYEGTVFTSCVANTGDGGVCLPVPSGPEPDCTGGCPCGPLAPAYTTQVADCAALTDADACRESYQGDPTTDLAVPCRLGAVTTGDVITCTTGPGLCTAVSGRVPTPGLESCRGTGCVCDPAGQMLFNPVDDCSQISEQNAHHVVCQSSYQGSVEDGTAVICERFLNDGGSITCQAAADTPCIPPPACDAGEALACSLDICDNLSFKESDINGTCCQCPAQGSGVTDPIEDHFDAPHTLLRLTFDLPVGYTLGFVGGGSDFGLGTSLVAPPAYQAAVPYSSDFGPPLQEHMGIDGVVYDSYVTVGDYSRYNVTVDPDDAFFIDRLGGESTIADWDTGGLTLNSSSNQMYAVDYPSGQWNTGSGTVIFQLTLLKADYDIGCGPASAPCATALIGGAIDPLGAAPDDIGSTQISYHSGVQWVRQVTWTW